MRRAGLCLDDVGLRQKLQRSPISPPADTPSCALPRRTTVLKGMRRASCDWSEHCGCVSLCKVAAVS